MGTTGVSTGSLSTILKADIESFINSCLEDDITASDLTEAIKLCLRDLSNMGLLLWSDNTIDVEDGDLSFVLPTDWKDVDSIVLVDSSGDRTEPLTKFPGGHKEYLSNMASSDSTGIPEYYSIQGGSVYLYPPPDGDYDVLLTFKKYDNQDDTNIEFGTEFSNAVKFGSLYFYAMMKGRERYVALWQQKYENEKEFRRLNLNQQPYIVR